MICYLTVVITLHSNSEQIHIVFDTKSFIYNGNKAKTIKVNEINIRHPLLGMSPKRKDLVGNYLEILSKMQFGLCPNITMLFLLCLVTHLFIVGGFILLFFFFFNSFEQLPGIRHCPQELRNKKKR